MDSEEGRTTRIGLRNGQRSRRPERVERARAFRENQSSSEEVLWALLRKERTGFKFRRQHPVLGYTLDFFCPEAKLNIEVDGEQHEQTTEWDSKRDADLAGIEVFVLRIPSLDLFEKRDCISPWLIEIVRLCEARTGRNGHIPELE